MRLSYTEEKNFDKEFAHLKIFVEKLTNETELLELLSKDCKSLGDKFRVRFYKHYWGYLMAVALRYVSDRDTACMIVNDSFMKIFTNLHTFTCNDWPNAHKMFKGWMAKITVRTALNEIRKHKTNRHEEICDERSTMPVTTLQDVFHEEYLLKIINQLNPVYKNVFMLYEIEGFSHDEIAELLGIAPSSSRVYLTRAKEKLKTLYRTIMN